MHKLLFIIAGLSLVHTMAFAATYSVDKDHTTVQFSIRHMMISNVKGAFNDVSGKIVMDEKDHSKDSADITIQTASVDTRNPKRDGHLKSPDFFDVAKYPTMTFKSTKVTSAGDNKFTVVGNLTLHGVTKPVTLDVDYSGTTKDPFGNQRAGFTASAKINRKDFGLTWNKPMEKVGGVMVGDDVKLDFDVEAIQDKAKM